MLRLFRNDEQVPVEKLSHHQEKSRSPPVISRPRNQLAAAAWSKPPPARQRRKITLEHQGDAACRIPGQPTRCSAKTSGERQHDAPRVSTRRPAATAPKAECRASNTNSPTASNGSKCAMRRGQHYQKYQQRARSWRADRGGEAELRAAAPLLQDDVMQSDAPLRETARADQQRKRRRSGPDPASPAAALRSHGEPSDAIW